MAGQIVLPRRQKPPAEWHEWVKAGLGTISRHGHKKRKRYIWNPAAMPTPEAAPETIESRMGIAGAEPIGPGGARLGVGAAKAPLARGGRGERWQQLQRAGGTFELPIPIRGINKAFSVMQQPDLTSGDLLNVRPKDVLERRIRIGKRPGMVKAYNELIGNNPAFPVIALCQIVVVE